MGDGLLALILEALPSHIAVLDPGGVIVRVNAAWRRFAEANGANDPDAFLGASYIDVCRKASLEGDEVAGAVLAGISSVARGAVPSFELRYPCPAADKQRWYAMSVTPLRNGGGVAIAHNDVTALVEAELAQKRLVSELNHRVKNTLAIVQALAHQTACSTPEPAQFSAAFSSRLGALAQVHDVLTRATWSGASVSDVVEAALRPFTLGDDGEARAATPFRLEGPVVLLDTGTAVSFSLAVYELATNAVKYGALSVPGGSVAISWSVADGGRLLTILWRESGGPPTSPPQRVGFGTRMLESLAMQADARLERRFTPDGLDLRLDLPLRISVPS